MPQFQGKIDRTSVVLVECIGSHLVNEGGKWDHFRYGFFIMLSIYLSLLPHVSGNFTIDFNYKIRPTMTIAENPTLKVW